MEGCVVGGWGGAGVVGGIVNVAGVQYVDDEDDWLGGHNGGAWVSWVGAGGGSIICPVCGEPLQRGTLRGQSQTINSGLKTVVLGHSYVVNFRI